MFAKLFARKPMTREKAEGIIQAYGAATMKFPHQVCDERELPYSKADIKEALLIGLNAAHAVGDKATVKLMREGFLGLGDWIKLNDNERSILYIHAVYMEAGPPSGEDKAEVLRYASHIGDYQKLVERTGQNSGPLLSELIQGEQV